MTTKLARISELSKENPDIKFNSIGHLIDYDMLKVCHSKMDGSKAVGTDGISKEEYDSNLDENLRKLVLKLKNKSYRPKPARRVEIPKDNGKTRLLSIYSYEDKLVQEALREIIEAVFEPCFYDNMCGFRPNRNCHGAIRKLNDMIEGHKTDYILDADIKGFFDNLSHDWIIKFISSRITDPNIIRLLERMLKVGVLEKGELYMDDFGAGQGSVCSPIIANTYMHYVLIWWFNEKIKPLMKGYCDIVVYADDFVCCFQYKQEAEMFYELLKKRMRHFGLTLEENKTRLIYFGRFAEINLAKVNKKPETFDFLGFTHYCSKSRNGKFRVKHRTARKKFRKKCMQMNELIRDMRFEKKKYILIKVNQILTGYYHYYGITDNYQMMDNFRSRVIQILFFWMNRRSQKKSYTWEGFNEFLRNNPIVKPSIYVNIYG
jgi:RNA-directed DNA polymerase